MKNIESTKSKIIISAIYLFSHNGKNGVAVADIARHAKVSKSLIYYHFRTKENLYTLIIRTELKKMINELYDRILDNHQGNLLHRSLIASFINYWNENPNLLHLLFYEINSGADHLLQFITAPQSGEVNMKIYNIFKLVDATFSNRSIDENERIQRFINFVGITMIYFLLQPFFDKLFDIPPEFKDAFIEKRIDTLSGIFQYLKKRSWL